MPLENLSEHSDHTGADNSECFLKRLNSVVSRIGTDQSNESIKELEQLLQCHKPDLMSLLANEMHDEEVDEKGYLKSLRQILKKGATKSDRTGVGTISFFGIQNRYNLKDGCLPLFTTKRVFFRGVLEELLWFIKGQTNSKILQEKGVHIWDANGSKEFLDSVGFSDREEGDLGPIYGFQWRHWGAKYIDSNTNYSGQGIDQLKNVIEKIKSNPDDRRLIVSAWNVADIPSMALPPCHCLFQFYVTDGKLSCRLDQRSADMGLGVPFNVASYSILTHMIAHVTNLEPGEFIHQIGDAHIYKNHVEGIEVQLSRQPRPFPKLKIKRKVSSIDDFKFEDFEVVDYNPHPAIKLAMAT